MDDLSRFITAAQRGDQNAFGNIYHLFYKRIYRYCRINTGNVQLAEDICQETFLKAWKYLPNFSLYKGGSFQAYLFRIARNLLIDQSRKKKEIALDETEEIEVSSDLEEKASKQVQEQKLQMALLKLNDLERQVVILKYFEELSGAEIAKILGLNEGTIRVKTHRVLKKLKEIVENL